MGIHNNAPIRRVSQHCGVERPLRYQLATPIDVVAKLEAESRFEHIVQTAQQRHRFVDYIRILIRVRRNFRGQAVPAVLKVHVDSTQSDSVNQP